jgi:hypothetical protein
MNSTDLSAEQAAAKQERIRQSLIYVGAMRERMDRRGFSPADRLYRHAAKAYDALHERHMGLKYLGCGLQAGNRSTGGRGCIVADANPWAAGIV